MLCLIMREATCSSERVDFFLVCVCVCAYVCVWSLTWLERTGSFPPTPPAPSDHTLRSFSRSSVASRAQRRWIISAILVASGTSCRSHFSSGCTLTCKNSLGMLGTPQPPTKAPFSSGKAEEEPVQVADAEQKKAAFTYN